MHTVVSTKTLDVPCRTATYQKRRFLTPYSAFKNHGLRGIISTDMADFTALLGALGAGAVLLTIVNNLFRKNREKIEVWSIERDNLHKDIDYLRVQLELLKEEVQNLREELKESKFSANDILTRRDDAYWEIRNILKMGDDDALSQVEGVLMDLQDVVGKRV